MYWMAKTQWRINTGFILTARSSRFGLVKNVKCTRLLNKRTDRCVITCPVQPNRVGFWSFPGHRNVKPLGKLSSLMYSCCNPKLKHCLMNEALAQLLRSEFTSQQRRRGTLQYSASPRSPIHSLVRLAYFCTRSTHRVLLFFHSTTSKLIEKYSLGLPSSVAYIHLIIAYNLNNKSLLRDVCIMNSNMYKTQKWKIGCGVVSRRRSPVVTWKCLWKV